MESVNWDEIEGLDAGLREQLQCLEIAVLAENPASIASILGVSALATEAKNALSYLPRQAFVDAFSRVIKKCARGAVPASVQEIHMKTMAHAAMRIPQQAVTRAKIFENLTHGVRVSTFTGGPHTFRKGGDLNDERCFLRPDKIDVPDVQILRRFFTDTYQEEYPNWLRILQANIPKDLTNEQADFATIRVNERLVAIAKSYPLGMVGYKTPYYFGTHYVDPAYQKDFGFGALVQATAMWSVPSNSPVYGYVAPSNRALFRHFHANGILGFGIGRDRDIDGESEELLQVVIAPHVGFHTASHTRYSDEIIAQWVQGQLLPEELAERVRVHSFEKPSREALIACMRGELAQNRVMTRAFAEGDKKSLIFEHRFRPNVGWIEWDTRQRDVRAAAGYSALDPRYLDPRR